MPCRRLNPNFSTSQEADKDLCLCCQKSLVHIVTLDGLESTVDAAKSVDVQAKPRGSRLFLGVMRM